MDKFWEDFETGDIHVRDKWQFELKSEFVPIQSLEESVFTQEFYIFIPNSLQINDQTYSKARFYEDQTNLIRYKTPEFTFAQLINNRNENSPLFRLRQLENVVCSTENSQRLERELKLFANVFRSTLRDQAHLIVEEVRNSTPFTVVNSGEVVLALIHQTKESLDIYYEIEKKLRKNWSDNSSDNIFGYTRDYLSISLNYSFSAVLEALREQANSSFKMVDEALCKILKEEKEYREERLLEPMQIKKDNQQNESILYQSGLLNKFFLDVLLLNTSRAAIDQKYRNLIGGIAAAVAMLFYILLFIWQGAVFVINSEPFILFTVIIYVLKDRLKDELKTISFNQAFRWFSDYKTEIITPSGRFVIGEIKESFSFIDEKNVPEKINNIRSRDFHTYLESIKRPERIIYYKKTIRIFQNPAQKIYRRLHALNIIFRYDIHRFLTKASDPYEPHVTLDSTSMELSHTELPKVYHVNIILKNTELHENKKNVVGLKKFRLVIDKEGIKRVENLAVNGENK